MARARLLSSIVVCVIGVAGAQPSLVELLETQPAAAKPRVTQPPRQETSAQPARKLDDAAVERGQRAFAQSCAFCHGADARGGAQGGSDLLQSAIVLEDAGGRQLGAFLKVGRPEKNMPRFELPAPQVSAIAAFLRSRVESAASSRRSNVSILVGDARAGAVYFNGPGGCTACHSVTGDLAGIGARYEPVMLQGRMVVPRGRGGYPGRAEGAQDKPLRATVTPPHGGPISGDVVYLSDFHVTLQDDSGRRHTFTRRGDVPKVDLVDPLQAHLALLRTLTDKDMHDLTAYLSTLK